MTMTRTKPLATRTGGERSIVNLSLSCALLAMLVLGSPSVARADNDDPGTGQEVCGAFNLGVPPDQIAQDLQRNDHRINEWQAQRDTNWPIISGDCDH